MWWRTSLIFLSLLCLACDGINEGLKANGGGTISYSINGKGNYEMEIDVDDATLPGCNSYECWHWASFDATNKKRGDYLKITVYEPSLGTNTPVTSSTYTYFILENGLKASVFGGNSTIRFDERSDSLWVAYVNLLFQSCGQESCSNDTTEGIRVKGWLHYYADPDDY